MSEVLVTPATVHPIDLDQAKLFLRVTHDEEDDEIEAQIQAATRFCEDRVGQQFLEATWRATWDCFNDYTLYVPRPPLISVTSLKYIDNVGVQQTLGTTLYQVDADSRPARIRPSYGNLWPTFRGQMATVELTYKAGYGTTAAAVASLQPCIPQAVKFLLSHWFNTREPIVVGSISSEVQLTLDSILSQIWHGGYLR